RKAVPIASMPTTVGSAAAAGASASDAAIIIVVSVNARIIGAPRSANLESDARSLPLPKVGGNGIDREQSRRGTRRQPRNGAPLPAEVGRSARQLDADQGAGADRSLAVLLGGIQRATVWRQGVGAG